MPPSLVRLGEAVPYRANAIKVARIRSATARIEGKMRRGGMRSYRGCRATAVGRRELSFQPQREPAAWPFPLFALMAEASIGQGRLDCRRRGRGPNRSPAMSLQQCRDDAR